jgi:hypothetical protein
MYGSSNSGIKIRDQVARVACNPCRSRKLRYCHSTLNGSGREVNEAWSEIVTIKVLIRSQVRQQQARLWHMPQGIS